MHMTPVETEKSFDAEENAEPEASFEPKEETVSSEASFDPEESELPAFKAKLAELKLQLLQKQQEVDAQKLEIAALKLEKQKLEIEHNIAICNLQKELRLGFVATIKEIVALTAK